MKMKFLPIYSMFGLLVLGLSCKSSDKTQKHEQIEYLGAEDLEGDMPPQQPNEPSNDEDILALTNYDIKVLKDSKSAYAYRPAWSMYYRAIFQNGVQLERTSDVVKEPGSVFCEAVFRTYFFKFRRSLEKGQRPLVDEVSQTLWNRFPTVEDVKFAIQTRNGTRTRKFICTKIDSESMTVAEFRQTFGEFLQVEKRN